LRYLSKWCVEVGVCVRVPMAVARLRGRFDGTFVPTARCPVLEPEGIFHVRGKP
jgi:hypothetical protein